MMSEPQEMECEETEEAQEEDEGPGIVQNGMVRGVSGKKMVVNGVLDLRGVPAEQVEGVESVVVNGVVLLDEQNRGALANAKTVVNGPTVVADPDLKVLVQPDLEFSKAMLEGMTSGQKLMVIGNIYFRPDVPPALVAEKLAEAHVIGIVIACEGVHGALMDRAEVTGVSVALDDNVRAVVRAIGNSELTKDYLSRLEDSATYINIGNTSVSEDVPEDLLAQKIAAYHNVGNTTAPAGLLGLLKARCKTNMGNFSEPGEDDDD